MKRILLTTALEEESEKAVDALFGSLEKLEPSEILTRYGDRMIWALAVLIIGSVIVRWTLNFIMKKVHEGNLASGATKFVHGIIAFLLYFIVLLTVASVLGIPITSVLTIFSVFTLAFSLAIKDIIALFASGITILASKPFKSGDFIEIPDEGVSGYVSDVGLIHTHLYTIDNKEIIIPNSIVAADTLINYSKSGLRRLDSVFSIGYNEDFEKARKIILDVVNNDPLVEKESEIFVMMTAMSASTVDIVCKVYVKWDSYETLRCRLNEEVKAAFDENGIEIPFNQIDVHMK